MAGIGVRGRRGPATFCAVRTGMRSIRRCWESWSSSKSKRLGRRRRLRLNGVPPMWDMRNVAAEKTMPLRLDPDPARACPAPIRRTAIRSRRPRELKPAEREAAEQVIATFLGEEAKLSTNASPKPTHKPLESRERKKSATPADLPPIIRRPEMRRRRMKLAEAMREVGLDEAAVAETLMEILTRRRKSPSSESADVAKDKLLLDVVKVSVRILDAARSAETEAAEDVPTIFRLTHHIPRPVRGNSAES